MARRSAPSALAATLAAATAALLALTGCSAAVVSDRDDPSTMSAAPRVLDVAVPAVSARPDAGGTPASKPNVIVVPLPIVTPPPSGGGGSGNKVTVDAAVKRAAAVYAQQLFTLTNNARSAAGVARLAWSSCAASAALGRAARALPKSQLQHEPLTFSCKHGWAGENLALNFGSSQAMFDSWMASTGHRENILRPEFTSIGIGCVAFSKSAIHRPATRVSDIGGYLCSQVFFG